MCAQWDCAPSVATICQAWVQTTQNSNTYLDANVEFYLASYARDLQPLNAIVTFLHDLESWPAYSRHFSLDLRGHLQMKIACLASQWCYINPPPKTSGTHAYRSLMKKGPLTKERPPPTFGPISCIGSKFTWMSAHPGASFAWRLRSTTSSAMRISILHWK